ncbi:thiamine ABC transporter substrate-binding protein [Stenoxybacter acetivorans]|uniref:thiamine ABC transporter substrate-binding protein n=1 Tax=Stenoxybacter acetivorans TaxID=422441 RepID=UPI0005629E94|nr:thiamine ABC transporter substrate-binding protein [Stenoxybacter acetivorans]
MVLKKYGLAAILTVLSLAAHAQPEVRLAVHKSFDLPKTVLAKFEQDKQVKLSVIKVGSGNEMLNKLILTRAAPIADAVYGLDNSNIAKAKQAGILAEKQPPSRKTIVNLPDANAIDYGYVVLNYDKAWFKKNNKSLPKTLADLSTPTYKDLLVLPSPATSSVGLAFLMANIAHLGENNAFQWWADMRKNGVKVTQGWSDAYYTDFTQNGGSRPLVVGYATSPAAEVFYSKGKYSEPPTGNLFLAGGVFKQVEGAAVLNRAKEPKLAAELVQYLQSDAVQQAIPESMWVYPAVANTAIPAVFQFAGVPAALQASAPADMADKQMAWVKRWTRTVLR